MVLVDVFFSNGTVRMDVSQAVIDFYEKQGVRVEIVQATGQTLRMEQVRFPVVSETFQGINGAVVFTGNIPDITSFILRILVINLTGDNRTERKIKFQIDQRVSYLVAIPQGSERVRLELQGFTPDGQPVSNVFNQTFVKTDTPPPPDFRTCNDCKGGTVRIPVDQECPDCGAPPPSDKPPKLVNLDGLVIGAIAVGALLMGRGKK